MKVANKDVFSDLHEDTKFQSILALLQNDILDNAFAEYETAAVNAKRRFHTYGRIAIGLIVLASLMSVAEALIFQGWGGLLWLTFIAALFAIVGIGVQVWILVARQKDKWMINRFAAERLRSLKFQAFQFAAGAQDEVDLGEKVEAFSRAELQLLKEELNAGVSAVTTFKSDVSVNVYPSSEPVLSPPALGLVARDAYERLRVAYQLRFSRSELERIKRARRILSGFQDFIYLGAALAAFVSLSLKVTAALEMTGAFPIADFLTIALFIISASIAIIDNATLDDPSQVRFLEYVKSLEDVQNSMGDVPLTKTIIDLEKISLKELDNFCKSMEAISYRL